MHARQFWCCVQATLQQQTSNAACSTAQRMSWYNTRDSVAVAPYSRLCCFSTPKKLRKWNLVFIVKLYHLVDAVVFEAIASTILPTFLAAFRGAAINIISILSVVVFQNRTSAASLSLMKWLAMVNLRLILPP